MTHAGSVSSPLGDAEGGGEGAGSSHPGSAMRSDGPARPQDERAWALRQRIADGVTQAGGWWPFERLMQAALYEPELGYYSSHRRILGAMPADGSDFVTAPELSPLFGQTVARQLAQVMAAGVPRRVWEFGAGSGALAATILQALDALGQPLERYTIMDVSGSLKAQQQQRLAAWGDRVQWLQSLPDTLDGVILGNEVLDAMPVRRLRWSGSQWLEQGVTCRVLTGESGVADVAFDTQDRVCHDTPSIDDELVSQLMPDTLIEVHDQAEAFVATVTRRMGERSLALMLDYGFPAAEFYHPQRVEGTLMCHRAHQADADPLQDLGSKDITAHVNFTGIALAAQAADAHIYGYTSQGRFLLNAGLPALMAASSLPAQNAALKLINEHEMGELFKVIAWGRGLQALDLIGFAAGDRTHRL